MAAPSTTPSTGTGAGAGARAGGFGHPCAIGPPIDPSDNPPVYFLKDFDPSKLTFTEPCSSWEPTQGVGVTGANGGAVGGRGGARGAGRGGAGRGGAGREDTRASNVFQGPQNSRTMYCRLTDPPFRMQLPKAVIQKISISGRGDETGEGSVIPDNASDAEILRSLAGQLVNLKIRFDDLERPENAAEREAFELFWDRWENAAVQVFIQKHDTLYPSTPLVPAMLKDHLSPEAYRAGVLDAAKQIFKKKSPLFFQRDTTNSYTVRVRVRVPARFDPRATAFNECTFFRNNGVTDAAGALNLEMCDASVLRRGARVVVVFSTGGVYMNLNGDVGHHVQAHQMVVEPYANTIMSPAQRLSVHLPGVSSINILVPSEAPEIPTETNLEETTSARKRTRADDESKIAEFFEDPGQNHFA